MKTIILALSVLNLSSMSQTEVLKI